MKLKRYTLAVSLYAHLDVLAQSDVEAADKLARTFDDWQLSKQELHFINAVSGFSAEAHIVRMSCTPYEEAAELVAVNGRRRSATRLIPFPKGVANTPNQRLRDHLG